MLEQLFESVFFSFFDSFSLCVFLEHIFFLVKYQLKIKLPKNIQKIKQQHEKNKIKCVRVLDCK